MATATKEKNGKVTTESLADVANQFAQEAKAVTNTWLDVTNKAAEDGKTILEAQQALFKDNFALLQEYTKNYFDFVFGAEQQMFDEALAVRERLFELSANNIIKIQKAATAEQELVLETTEAFWTQAQTASERLAKMANFVPVK